MMALTVNKSSAQANFEENLKKWFAESPVHDGAGKPRVLFHGSKTPDQLTDFKIGGAKNSVLSGDAYGVGAYFTSSAREAAFYAGQSGAVFPVFVTGDLLDLDKQLLSADESLRLTNLARELLLPSDKARFSIGRERRVFDDRLDAIDFFQNQRENWKQFGDGMCRAEPEALVEGNQFVVEFTNYDAEVSIETGADASVLLKAIGWDNLRIAGFDGLMFSREDGTLWVVMHNADGKIKSATGNIGVFDKYCSDITDHSSQRAIRCDLEVVKSESETAETNTNMSSIAGRWNEQAPNGLTVGENFVKWFGDSKVIDSDGSPLVAYHGSTRGGVISSTVSATFFSSSPSVASTYAFDDYHDSIGDERVVQAAYLKMENPLIVDAMGEQWMRIQFEGRRYTTDDLAVLARHRKFDGLIIKNVEDNVNDEELSTSDIYVTLGKRAQIKSALGNSGLFDPESNNIVDHEGALRMVNKINAARAIEMLERQETSRPKYAP